jgi:GTP-binding protein
MGRMQNHPTIAILGRPNVGKSTLFNRLIGKRLALVDDQPGVTRDRRYGDGDLAGLKFRIIDTAGLEEAEAQALQSRMMKQTNAAIAEADILLFVIDARVGLTPVDEFFARHIRQSGKPAIAVANKAEGKAADAVLGDLYSLGFSHHALISAEHNEGMGDLYEALVACGVSEEQDGDNTEDKRINLVILGRPNAGKSTLINALIDEERMLTGPEAGITRDAIAVPFTYNGTRFNLFDTAGMRKRANMQGKIEKLAVSDSIRALTYAEVVVLLMDATVPLEKQDATLGALIEREGRAVVIGLNKFDLIKGSKEAYLEEFNYLVGKHLPQLKGVPVVPMSATKKRGLDGLLGAVLKAREVWNIRIPTGELNRWLEGVITHHTPPLIRGRRLKIKYLTQVKTRPPTFHLFANLAADFPAAYLKYMVHGLRDTFHLHGTPIRMIVKGGGNPYDNPKKRRIA